MGHEVKLDDRVDLSVPPGDEIKTTTCYMCACRCGINVHLKDGKVRYIEGNRDHPVNKRRALRQGRRRHHAALLAGPAARAAAARRPARLGRVQGDLLGRGARHSPPTGSATSARRDPSKLAFFTGRDQSQSLTGWWAQQFGTPNYAAHGGFCSVNMAAAGLYTFGGSFWEFGEPDWERTKLLPAVRRRRGSRLQPDQDRPRQAQGARRQGRRGQSGPHRLRRHRRRMDRHQARHRRPVRRSR